MRKLTIQDCINVASKKGGTCMSTHYINSHSKMIWKCNDGHAWSTSFSKIKNDGSWCPYCSGIRFVNGLREAQKIAKRNSGKCLSVNYINSRTKMLWECEKGHRWKSTFSCIKSYDTWCPKCSIDKITLSNGLDISNKIAKEKGGECLSAQYINSRTKMRWKCNNDHIWTAKLGHIKYDNSWCPKCAKKIISKNINNSYVLYHWKNNEELICQGSYEKRVVEYLNNNKINFRWQPKIFIMPDGRTYRPDLYLFSAKKWIEIKGYFWDDAQEKWEWFKSTRPNSELWNEVKLKEMGIL